MSRVFQSNGKKFEKTQSECDPVLKKSYLNKNDTVNKFLKNYEAIKKPQLNSTSTSVVLNRTSNKYKNEPEYIKDSTGTKPSKVLQSNDNNDSFETFGNIDIHPKEANSFRKLDVWNDNDASFPRTSLLATNNADKDDNDDFKHSLEFFREDAQSTNLNKANDIIDLLKNNVIQFCPVCLKKNITNQTTVFLPHLKNCAAKNKVSTDQLLKAIELQQKQTIERAALGLPAVIQDKSAPKRPIVRKVKTDSNLELAIALSASLRESEMMAKLRETETLLEAGLEKEALSQCKQLEDFGFISSSAAEPNLYKSSSRSKSSRNTILFTRSQEERERIITEKVAIILVETDDQDIKIETKTRTANLKSRFLRKYRDEDATLWTKSHHANDHSNYGCYYVENISSYVSPCKLSVGAKLKHLSQIPCRPISPGKTRITDNSLSELAKLFSSETNKFIISSTNTNFQDVPRISEQNVSLKQPLLSNSKLSRDWKLLVNKRVMSDIMIYVKDEKSIYAHKLVLYTRFRSVLSEIIKETNGDKCTEMLMWMEYAYNAVIIFLEYIYTGELADLKNLTNDEMTDLRNLCSRYSFGEILNQVNLHCAKDYVFNEEIVSEIKEDYKQTVTDSMFQPSENTSKTVPNIGEFKAHSAKLTKGERNLLQLKLELQTQKSVHLNPLVSPEMFDNLEIMSDVNKLVKEVTSDHKSDCIIDNTENESNAGTFLNHQEIVHSNESTINKSVVEEILSNLCTPRQSNITSSPNSFSRMLNFEHISKLSDQGFADLNLEPAAQISYEKRKSYSPLDENKVKKTKIESQAINRNLKIKFESDCNTPVKKHLKSVSKKSPLKELLTLSDSDVSTDSDLPLFALDKSINLNIISDSNEPVLNLEEEEKKQEHKNQNTILNQNSVLEGNDYSKLCSEKQINNHRLSYDKSEIKNMKDNIKQISEISLLEIKNEIVVDDITSPFVSPVWDGFEEANYDLYDNYFPSEFDQFERKPLPLLKSSKVSSPLKSHSVRNKSLQDKFSDSSIPFADSFSIDESALCQLEDGSKMQLNRTKMLETVNITPQNIRKFKCRSKSDNILTPSRSKTEVTPMADYSNMKSTELKIHYYAERIRQIWVKTRFKSKQSKEVTEVYL